MAQYVRKPDRSFGCQLDLTDAGTINCTAAAATARADVANHDLCKNKSRQSFSAAAAASATAVVFPDQRAAFLF